MLHLPGIRRKIHRGQRLLQQTGVFHFAANTTVFPRQTVTRSMESRPAISSLLNKTNPSFLSAGEKSSCLRE